MRCFISCMIVSITILVTCPCVQAKENPLAALWPFGKAKAEPKTFDNIDPFRSASYSSKSDSSDKTLGLPSPSKILDSAEKRTGSMLQKTRKSWKSMQNFGRSLNPFANNPKTKPTPKAKKSFFDSVFSKKPAKDGSPATMNDFMSLQRPKF